jgi:hypothetical protein
MSEDPKEEITRLRKLLDKDIAQEAEIDSLKVQLAKTEKVIDNLQSSCRDCGAIAWNSDGESTWCMLCNSREDNESDEKLIKSLKAKLEMYQVEVHDPMCECGTRGCNLHEPVQDKSEYQECGCPVEYPCSGGHPVIKRELKDSLTERLIKWKTGKTNSYDWKYWKELADEARQWALEQVANCQKFHKDSIGIVISDDQIRHRLEQ